MGAGDSKASLLASSEANFVRKKVQDNCVVIFSKSTCPYCHMAKGVFNNIGHPYEAVELNKLEGGPIMQQVLKEMTGVATVPQVFVNGQCIGGGRETKTLHEQGKLLPLLETCGTSQTREAQAAKL